MRHRSIHIVALALLVSLLGGSGCTTGDRSCADGCPTGTTCIGGACAGLPPPPPRDPGDDPPPPPPPAPCGGSCEPGHACVDDVCVADCRLPAAISCGVGMLCSDETGRCAVPGTACTPAGAFVECGSAEFAPTCGPGSICDGSACVPDEGCRSVTCDGVGVCRGVGCPTMGGTVAGVTLDEIADAERGAPGGISARATVGGEELCGLTVTFEVRVETSVFTSAGNDNAVFEVDLRTGERTAYMSDIPGAFGLATDPTGRLYLLRSDTCEVGRIVADAAGVRRFERIATGPERCARLALGPDGALYVAGGTEVHRIDLFTLESALYGSIPGSGGDDWFGGGAFITGLAFHDDGTLYVGEHWPSLYTIAPGGGPAAFYVDAPSIIDEWETPWNEGMAFGPDGDLHVAVFPVGELAGLVYRVRPDRTSDVVVDLMRMQRDVPSTQFAGIHSVAFGLDGAMYFTNQNTDGDSRMPHGQLLVQRPGGGPIEVLAEGFNFDWPDGFDGDLIVGTQVLASETVPIDEMDTAATTFDVPDIEGAYQVRVYVTDPATGRIFTDRRAARTL